jgi:hypothetical protein
MLGACAGILNYLGPDIISAKIKAVAYNETIGLNASEIAN